MNALSPMASLRRIINDPARQAKVILTIVASFWGVAFAYQNIQENNYFGLIALIFIGAGWLFALRAASVRKDRARVVSGSAATKKGAVVLALSNHGATLLKTVNTKIEALTVEKSKIVAGLAGERTVGDFLLRHLNDQWTIIEGFKGVKGEIDFLLIGPLGVFAIEVKNRSGMICVNGDQWTLIKPDGSIEPLQDNGGRSPARQINESAGWLASSLHHAGFPVSVPTAIIWAHPKAHLGNPINLVGVSYLFVMGAGLEQHFRKYLALGERLTQDQVAGVVLFVKSIHKGG